MPYSMAIWLITTVAVVSIAMLELAGRVFARGAIALMTPNVDAILCPRMTIVVLAVTDNLPKSDRDIVIQRRATMKPHDVILVRPRALRPDCSHRPSKRCSQLGERTAAFQPEICCSGWMNVPDWSRLERTRRYAGSRVCKRSKR